MIIPLPLTNGSNASRSLIYTRPRSNFQVTRTLLHSEIIQNYVRRQYQLSRMHNRFHVREVTDRTENLEGPLRRLTSRRRSQQFIGTDTTGFRREGSCVAGDFMKKLPFPRTRIILERLCGSESNPQSSFLEERSTPPAQKARRFSSGVSLTTGISINTRT